MIAYNVQHTVKKRTVLHRSKDGGTQDRGGVMQKELSNGEMMNIKRMFLTFTEIDKWWDPIPESLSEFFEGCAGLVVATIRLIIIVTSPLWFVPVAIRQLISDYHLSKNLDIIGDAARGRAILKMCIDREQITGFHFYSRIINYIINLIAHDEERHPSDVWDDWYRSYKEREK